MSDDKSKIFENFKNKRKEISVLRNILNSVNTDKEKFYSNKDEYSKEIKELISEIKSLKAKRDELTKLVRETKKEKDKVVKNVKAQISKITGLKQQKYEIAKKQNLKGDPMRIKKQIEALETQVETEAISFDKEQKIMKKIRELRNKFSEYSEIEKVFVEINALSKEIDGLKTSEKELKKTVRKNARDSQKQHEKMLVLSDKVDKLKVMEKAEFHKFTMFKTVFTETNMALKELLGEFGKIKDGVHEAKQKKRRDREEKDKNMIEQRKREVQDKIKKGEKLTTEDLLIFQN